MKTTTSMTHLLLAFFLLISVCSSAQTEAINAKRDATVDPDKVLIVYLSRTNNTKVIAEMIHENVSGTLVALALETPYPNNYQATVQQVQKEWLQKIKMIK